MVPIHRLPSLLRKNLMGLDTAPRPGLPPPQARRSGNLEVSEVVLVQRVDRPAETLIPLTLHRAWSNGTETAGPHGPNPDRSVASLHGLENEPSGKLRILRELAVLPTGEALQRANPQSAVACNQEGADVT